MIYSEMCESILIQFFSCVGLIYLCRNVLFWLSFQITLLDAYDMN